MNLTEWLKSSILAIIATLLLFSAKAQKKVIAVTQSTLTGIALPAGSKQDSRMLIKASGRALLEMETKKSNTTISKMEILYLPANAVGADAASIVKLLLQLGGQLLRYKLMKNMPGCKKTTATYSFILRQAQKKTIYILAK